MPQVPTKSNIIRRTSVPVVFALGAITALSFRGNAISPGSPVLPPPQALEAQTASEQVAEKLRPSVVFIESLVKARPVAQTPQDGGGENPFGFPSVPGAPGSPRFRMVPPPRGNASGSGVIVRSDGYILTNDHVVEGADKVRVKLLDGRTFYGKVMRDFKSDLALIKVDATNLPAAELADSDRVKVGQWAAAFGSPFGLTDTMTSGIISSLHRNQQIGGRANDARYYSSLLQTDASVNPGNSGGPLVDLYGRVVGINVAIESPSGASAGIGFAIPANTAKYVMEQLITNGSVTRGFLGLSPRSLEYSERAQYKVEAGALVTSIQQNSPADKAGIQVEDVITSFNGKKIVGETDLREGISRLKPGSEITIEVSREGQSRTLNAKIGAPTDTIATAKPEQKIQPDAPQGKLGVAVGDLSDEDVQNEYKFAQSVKRGAVVTEVTPGSPAADAGLKSGDLILRMAGKPVNKAEDVKAIARLLKSGMVNLAVLRGEQTVLVSIELD